MRFITYNLFYTDAHKAYFFIFRVFAAVQKRHKELERFKTECGLGLRRSGERMRARMRFKSGKADRDCNRPKPNKSLALHAL